MSDSAIQRFDGYEIRPMVGKSGISEECESTLLDEDADFFTLFGHMEGSGAWAIGDFPNRETAELTYSRITGKKYTTLGSPA